MTVIYIYGPNKDNPNLFSALKRDFERYENSVILAGDFNIVLNPNTDTLNDENVNKHQAREKVIQIISDCGLIDCWRELNAEKSL